MDLVQSGDSSFTLYSERFGQHYHSKYGAYTESMRVFIELGFRYIRERFSKITIFEMGFGTGLNAQLSQIDAEFSKIKTSYDGLEAFPINDSLALKLDYGPIHGLSWEDWHTVSDFFDFRKRKGMLEEVVLEKERYNLIYFDAFAPESQPELWSVDVFEKMYEGMQYGGALCTYCSKVQVQKNLKAAGFVVEKHLGPPHKREVIRAVKLS
ncbi:MAG: tRNA (5-methylaminomethyl-2-thiouridine)(34)-methyltransferase MnmD [Leadbetterella sp.]